LWILVVYLFCFFLALLTATGSARRGNARVSALREGLMWQWTRVAWFGKDNRAAGRRAFQGHRRS
jgi:hypothetical protein